MKKFIYKKISIPSEISDGKLNALGKQGWELCGITFSDFGFTYYIKKEIS